MIIAKIDVSDVGILIIYDFLSKSVKISWMHIDKRMIGIQHHWTSMDHLQECNHGCLNDLRHMNQVRIGMLMRMQIKLRIGMRNMRN